MAFCGCLPEEQKRRQPFSIDVDIVFDTAAAAASDDLTETVDYDWVVSEINKYFEKNKVKLIEKMAQVVADITLTDKRIQEVRVRVKKLHVPVSYPLDSAGISIIRTQKSS